MTANGRNLEAYRKIIFWGLFFVVTALPFLFSGRSFHLVLIKTVFFKLSLSFLLFVWLLKVIRSEFIKIPGNPIILPFGLFLLYAFLSACFSAYKYASFQVFLSILGYFLFFVLVAENIKKRREIRFLAQGILITAGAICLFSLYKSITFLRLDFWNVPVYFHFFGNPNFFASYLLAVIPLSFSLFLYSHFKFEKAALFFLSMLLAITLLLTRSQGAWLVLIFYLAVLYIGSVVNFWRKKKFVKSFISALLPFLLVGGLYSVTIYSQALREVLRKDRLQIKTLDIKKFLKEEDSSFAEEPKESSTSVEKFLFPGNISMAIRENLWMSGWQMIKAFPFTGRGVGAFHIYFPQYRTAESLRIIPVPLVFHAHNEFLEIAIEMGFLGLGLFLWIIFAFLSLGIKLWREAPIAWKKYPLAFTLGAAGILLHSQLSPSLRWTAIAVFFWLMVALTVSVKRIIASDPEISVPASWRGFITFRNRFFPVFKPVKKGLLYALAVVLFLPLSFKILKPYQADVALKKGIKALEKGDIHQAIIKFSEAKKINPYSFPAYYKLGYCYRAIGEYQRSLKIYQALEKMFPDYARIHYNLGCLYRDLGRFKEAIAEFKTSLKRENELFPHYRLEEIYAELDELDLRDKERAEIKRLEGSPLK